MAEIYYFKSRADITAAENLNLFVDHCRSNLTLYEDQGGFDTNAWHYKVGGKKFAMIFSKYKEYDNQYEFDPMEEPFLDFAKSYVRYRQSERQVTNIGDTLAILRVVHDALIDVHDTADVLNVDGLVQDRVFELIDIRYSGSDKRYFYGCKLINLFGFLCEKNIAPTLPDWTNPWKKAKEKAIRVDKASRKWQEERCPSQHHMLSLADCFAKAKTPQDRYWSSVLALLMFAPSRGGELAYLTVDSLEEDQGTLAVRWFSEKGYDQNLKRVPDLLAPMVREAFDRLLEIGKPARDAAKFAYDNPGVFYRHPGCATDENHPETKPLNALEFANAMNFSKSSINKLTSTLHDYNCESAWNVFNAHQSTWIKDLRKSGNPSYGDLANYVFQKYKNDDWPHIPKIDRPVWEVLWLIRDKEFHSEHMPKLFSWYAPDVDRINDQLGQRSMKNPIPTIFQRFGIKDEDGSEICLVSHQLRVWLSTVAERGGMDTWMLAQWAGRARIEDNKHYDLRTKEERQNQIQILQLTERPTAIEAIKLNLPVAYVDLGIDRPGIADPTLFGMCVHDYAMSPCPNAAECMTCKDHRCIKGMPNTLERIIRLEGQVEVSYAKACRDEAAGVYGAGQWGQYFKWKLAHIRTQRIRLEDEDTPNGAVLSIPPEHDPSPVERALIQNGHIKVNDESIHSRANQLMLEMLNA